MDTIVLEHGAKVHQGYNGRTALHEASTEAVASLLLEFGANIKARDRSQWTPLHAACYFGCEQVVSVLIENGADVDAQSEDGFSPLYLACWVRSTNGHEGIVEKLLR